MNDLELKNLFARFGRKPVEAPDVDTLLELARLPHAEEAASPLHADLLRFSRDLEPVSERLGADLAMALDEAGPVATHRRSAPRRAAFAPRRWRVAVASAMAASLIVAVALVATHRRGVHTQEAASAARAVPDRIFAGFNERNMAASKASPGDEIFRGNFLPDEIFSSSRHHEG